VPTVFWWGSLIERDFLKDLELKGNITLKWNFKKCDEGGHGLD